MRFQINFYIYIYDHPMFIIRNFDTPKRDVHLSYHEGQHYNSVRLIGDDGSTVPQRIPLEKLGLAQNATTEFIDYDLINSANLETNNDNCDEGDGDNNEQVDPGEEIDEELEKVLAMPKNEYETSKNNKIDNKEVIPIESNKIKDEANNLNENFDNKNNPNESPNDYDVNNYENDYTNDANNYYDINYNYEFAEEKLENKEKLEEKRLQDLKEKTLQEEKEKKLQEERKLHEEKKALEKKRLWKRKNLIRKN